MRTYIELDHDEVAEFIPYMLIAETASRSIWDTGKRKRRWRETFTPKQQERCNELIRDAKRWALKTGVPKIVKMTSETYDLWQELSAFCITL